MKSEALYDKFLSTWCGMVDAGMFEEAAQIDMMQYNEQIRKTEDVSVWTRWQNDTSERRYSLVDLAGNINPTVSRSSDFSSSVALVYHNYSGLAHETQLARNIAYLKREGLFLDIHVIYAFGKANSQIAHQASIIHGVPISNIHFIEASNYLEVGALVGGLNDCINFKSIIYPSEYYLAYWASLMLPHPNQKFLSMKYFPLKIGRFSDFAGGRGDGNDYFLINNQEWRQLSILDIFSRTDLENFDYRRFHSSPTNFGSISRIEKASDDEYQNYIFEVLRRHESLEYIYFGSDKSLHLVSQDLRSHPRAKFLGWANPESAIKLFSIYLETFPWGGGEMSLLALKTGIPYLCLATDENKSIGICRFLMYVAKNDPSGLASEVFCYSIDELNVKFDKMIKSIDYRESLRAAWLRIINEYKPADIDSWREFLLN